MNYYKGEWGAQIPGLAKVYDDVNNNRLPGCRVPKDETHGLTRTAQMKAWKNFAPKAKESLIYGEIQNWKMYNYHCDKCVKFEMHADAYANECFCKGLEQIVRHVSIDDFKDLCITPSFLVSRVDVVEQVPHIDYTWEQLQQAKGKPWAFNLPITNDGAQLNCWGVEDDTIDAKRNAIKLQLSRNEALLWPGDFIHGGGLLGKDNVGCAIQMHLYLEKDVHSMHISDNQRIEMNHSEEEKGQFFNTCLDENGNQKWKMHD